MIVRKFGGDHDIDIDVPDGGRGAKLFMKILWRIYLQLQLVMQYRGVGAGQADQATA